MRSEGPAQWRERLEQRRESGQSVRKWCEGIGIAYGTYKYWERKLTRGTEESTEGEVSFVEVIQTAKKRTEPEEAPYAYRIQVKDLYIEVGLSADPEQLGRIVERLRNPC